MTSTASSDLTRRFFTLAGKLSMLDAATADALASECVTRTLSASQVAMQKGALSTVQVDILETLLHPNETIPGYEIQDIIGHGGMGVVYRALQKNLQRPVALKTVLLNQVAQSSAAARFEQEAMAVARLRHPHVITAFDFGRHEGRLYVALELVDGEDADKAVSRNGRFLEREALWIARQTASGLAHAAEEGVVHRDIKPSNLLLVKPPSGYPLPAGVRLVKIADFGLAFLSQDDESRTRLTSTNTTLGSPHYMAPEQLSGAAVDCRTDIYGLGATLYHLLAGRPPFAGQSLTQIITNKLTTPPADLAAERDDLHPETVELVRCMLAREPKDRVPDYTQLIDRIDKCLERLQTPAGTSSPKAGFGKTPSAADYSTAPLALPDISHGGSGAATGFSAMGRSESLAENVTSRIDSSRAPVPPPPALPKVSHASRGALWLVSILAAVAVPLCIGYSLWRGGYRPGPRDMVPSGSATWLFNGQHLDLSNTLGGQWKVVDHETLGRVLSGADGAFRFPFAAGIQQRPMAHYRLGLIARLEQAENVEIRFGQAQQGNGEVYCLVISADRVQLGERIPGKESLVEKAHLLPEGGSYTLHSIAIERHSGDFFVKFDDKELGAVPGRAEELPEVHLVVEGGPAYFADVQWEELKPPAGR